tara:strand:+ start:308 stop:784 length:477 start_codon:yes stop_codon:yes gene_type:complete
MPEISPERAASDLGSETSTIYLDTLRFEHSQIDTLRLVDNTEDIERADGLYVAFPMRSVYPAQTGQRPPELKIDVDIVDQRVMIALRSLRGLREKPVMIVETVTAADHDDIRYGPARFLFERFETDGIAQGTITATYIKGALNNAYPARRFSPSSAGS